MTKKTTATAPIAEQAPENTQFQGRGAFIVETTAAGVAVVSTVITEDGRALAMPAIFPNLSYALSQIDELRAAVINHFDQAAQVGAQLIAEQKEKAQQEAQQEKAPELEKTH